MYVDFSRDKINYIKLCLIKLIKNKNFVNKLELVWIEIREKIFIRQKNKALKLSPLFDWQTSDQKISRKKNTQLLFGKVFAGGMTGKAREN